MTAAAYFVLLERRVAAWVQDRRGPNRVGIPLTRIRLFGLGQPLADGAKMILKEEYTPGHVDKRLFVLAPIVIMTAALSVYAVIPFGSAIPPIPSLGIDQELPLVVAPQLDVAVLYAFALSSIAVYGVILGGWASNNKYSFLGGLRSSAQMIAYELPAGRRVAWRRIGIWVVTIWRCHSSAGGRSLVCVPTATGILGVCCCCIRRGGAVTIRFARVRARVDWWLPHGVFGREVGAVLDGGVHPYDHGVVHDRDLVPRRMAFAVGNRRRYGADVVGCAAESSGPLRQDICRHLSVHAHPMELAKISL